MAAKFKVPTTPAEVATFFVELYYKVLQNRPDKVHHFYSDASTMVRIDENVKKLQLLSWYSQIQQLLMMLNYSRIEMKTKHSLESLNGGLLVMVWGSVKIKDFSGRKMFVETFFLAPKEKGYFILTDLFQYVGEEQILQHPDASLPQRNLDARSNSSDTVGQESKGGDIQSLELIAPAKVEENDPVSSYNDHEEHLQQINETENILDNVQSNNSCQGTMTSTPDHLSSPIEEPVVKTHTFILAGGQSDATEPSESSCKKPDSLKWQHIPKSPTQALVSLPKPVESSGVEGASVLEDEVEVKQVYVRNVPTTMSASEIAEKFKKFGKVKPGGVVIKTRKDRCLCYVFVEFEDISGVQNAIKASMVQIGSFQLYIERLRPKRNISLRGGKNKGGNIQSQKLITPAKVERNDPVSYYKNPEEKLQKITEIKNVPDNEQSIREPVTELAKGQSAATSESSCKKPDSLKWQHVPKSPSQASVSSPNPVKRSGVEEASVSEDEVEVKQVYVKNIPKTLSASEIAEEFKKFGQVKSDGVVIKTREDVRTCYAFVEFEDISGVVNAIKASLVQMGAHQLYIQWLSPKRSISLRQERGSGGRFSETIGGRGRFSNRGFGNGSNHNSM